MKTLELQIRNYQLISDGKLEFQSGLNCIVGESNNSKSSIIRAMETLCFNLPRERHVSFGETVKMIGVRYNGHTIVYKRDIKADSQVSYMIDGELYTKVGRNPLPAVMEALNIREVVVDDYKYHPNFSKQMSLPFLTDKTPAQLFKFLISSNSKHNLLDVLSLMKDDLSHLNKDFTVSEAKREESQKQIIIINNSINSILENHNTTKEGYIQYIDSLIYKIQSNIIPKEQELENIKRLNNSYIQNKQHQNRVSALITLIDSVNFDLYRDAINECYYQVDYKVSVINNMKKIIEVRKRLNTINNLLSSVSIDKPSMPKEYAKEYSLLADYISVKSKIDKTNKLIDKLNKIKSISIEAPKEIKLHLLKDALNSTQNKIKELNLQLDEVLQQKNQYKEQLKEFKYCPYCNSELSN